MVADAVTCGQTTMAVRMPSHAVARALIEAAGVPLAAPSANSSGRPSPTCAEHVMADLAAAADVASASAAATTSSECAEQSMKKLAADLAAAATTSGRAAGQQPPSIPGSGSFGVTMTAGPNGTAGPPSVAAVAMVLDGGPCGCGVESTVLDGLRQPPAVLRPGGVTFEQLRGLEGLEGLQVRACGGEI